MKYLLIGGAPNVGKTQSIRRLTLSLVSKGFKVIRDYDPNNDLLKNDPDSDSGKDIMMLIEGVDKHGKTIRIIINSATDTIDCMDNFQYFRDANPPADILISSIRDDYFYPSRETFFEKMRMDPSDPNIVEMPLAKITRTTYYDNSKAWYDQKVDNLLIHILNNSPFDL